MWGLHYQFVLHNIAEPYPKVFNQVTKHKYYDFIMNIPMFIPDSEIGNNFSNLLDKYPVTPYLDTCETFKRWWILFVIKSIVTLNKAIFHTITRMQFIQIITDPNQKCMPNNRKYINIIFIVFSTLLALILIYVYYK